jgi:hypothetical protein
MSVEIGLQEVPRAPKEVVARLQSYDKRLDLRFNVQWRCWEVVEKLPSGLISHCFYWTDGSWREPTYKPLPSAEALLAKLGAIDWARHGIRPKEFLADLRARGATERAHRLEQAQTVGATKFGAALKWYRANWGRIMRQMSIGGSTAQRAFGEYQEARRDLLGDKLLER